jgi:alcohol dehydrogenase, propanol-preferring
VFTEFDEEFGPAQLRPSFTLGHETSGWVEELGPGVSGFEKGDAYLVYGPTGCGHCRACSRGQDTYCENAATMPYLAVGLGRDGGMAEYVVAPARNLVPLGEADAVAAAPLADAALTPYHAIKLALPKLAGGGKYALVIGLGGLGQIAVQILTAITGATVIATDANPEAMERAAAKGALTVGSGPEQAEQIRALTGGRGVDAVFDLVGVSPTIELALKVVALRGRVTVVGIGNGHVDWNFYGVPYEVDLTSTYWGTVEELYEVVDLYRAGQITPEVERFSLDDAPLAYEKLIKGELTGRAVVTP